MKLILAAYLHTSGFFFENFWNTGVKHGKQWWLSRKTRSLGRRNSRHRTAAVRKSVQHLTAMMMAAVRNAMETQITPTGLEEKWHTRTLSLMSCLGWPRSSLLDQ
jgi:hypothetical protein